MLTQFGARSQNLILAIGTSMLDKGRKNSSACLLESIGFFSNLLPFEYSITCIWDFETVNLLNLAGITP